MIRGNPGDLQTFDPEIDRKFHRLVRHSVHLDHSVLFEHCEHFEHSEYSVAGDSEYSDFEHSTTNFHTENMAQPPPRERIFREMAAPDFTYESLCIQYPDEGVPYVLKTRLIHLLPKFHGLADENPHKHLKEFHIVCSILFYFYFSPLTFFFILTFNFLTFFPSLLLILLRD